MATTPHDTGNRVPRLDGRSLLEGFRDLGNPPAKVGDRRLACDPGFNRYSAYWVLGPTLDSVNHAMEAMNALDRRSMKEFIAANRASLRSFLGSHFDAGSGRFHTNSSLRTAGILGWQAGVGTVKALYQCSDKKSLGSEQFRKELIATGRVTRSFDPLRAVLGLLRESYEDGAFFDNPDEPLLPTLTTLHVAALVLWNLDKKNLRRRLGEVADLAEVERFIRGCLKSRDVGGRRVAAFTIHPDVEELCVNTTSFGLQLLKRLEIEPPPELRVPMINFLLLAYRGGGFSSTLWEPRSLNATFFGLRALERLMGDEWPVFIRSHAGEILVFLRSCSCERNVSRSTADPDAERTVGFRFAADAARYRQNCLATRYAIHVLDRFGLDVDEMRDQLDEIRGPAFSFLKGQYTPDAGGFCAYQREEVCDLARNDHEWLDRFLEAKDAQLMAAVTGQAGGTIPPEESQVPFDSRIDALYSRLQSLSIEDLPDDPERTAQRIQASHQLELLLQEEVKRLREQFAREYEAPIEEARKNLERAKALRARYASFAPGH